MNTEFDMQITAKDLYKFNMRQIYTGMNGVVGIVVPIICFIMAGVEFSKELYVYFTLYLVFGFVFLFYMPLSLWIRANHVMKKNTALSQTLHYQVDEEGIKVSVQEENATLPWDMIYKVIETKNMILVYSNRVNAYILIKEQLGDSCEIFKQIATSKLEKYRVRFKK